jgi:hypothetical protein
MMIVAFNFIIVASSCYYNNASYCNANVDLFEKCNSYDCVLSNYNNIFTSDDLFRYNTLFDYDTLFGYNNLSSRLNMQSEHELVDKFVYNNYMNDCINVLIIFFVVSTSLLFSILIVSICVYQKMVNQFVEKYNANKECYEYDTYFFEYLDEFNELDNIELVDDTLNLLELKYIKQKTPKGDVLMNYNNSNSSFDYYCKKSNSIDFLYLDVVSRIYVVKYNCKNIYVDNYDNFELIRDYYANVANYSSSSDELKENNIFYNKLNKKNKAKQPIEYVSNKYKYRGTFDDFNNFCKNNNYKIHTQNLLENDIFVLEKFHEINANNVNNENNETNEANETNEDDDTTQIIEINGYNKGSNKDSSNISFKTFKTMVAISSDK